MLREKISRPALRPWEEQYLYTFQGQYPQSDWEHVDSSQPTKKIQDSTITSL